MKLKPQEIKIFMISGDQAKNSSTLGTNLLRSKKQKKTPFPPLQLIIRECIGPICVKKPLKAPSSVRAVICSRSGQILSSALLAAFGGLWR
jgi:hypothetical protein